MDPSTSSGSLFSSSKSRHTFLDLISSSINEEDKHKLIHEYHQKNSLLNTGLLETYLAGEPLLLSFILLLLFLTLALFSLAVIVTTCRFLGKCGGRRYQVSQPFPLSSSRLRFLLLSFLLCWLVLASSSLNFVLSTASFYGARNPSQLVSVPVKSLSLDYPDYDRGKRESILTALFNDPDYDFDKIEEEATTTTTTEPSFVQETTQRMILIEVEEREPMVIVARNGEIEENGQVAVKQLVDTVDTVDEEKADRDTIDRGTVDRGTVDQEPEPEDNDGEEEEYIEGEEGDEEESTSASPRPTTRPTVTSTTPRPTVPSTRPTVPTPRSTTAFPRVPTQDRSPHWVNRIGEGEDWEDILKRGQNLPPATTRRITIQRVTTTVPVTTTTQTTTTTTEPTTTTTEPTTTTTTPSTTTTTTMEPTTTTTTTARPVTRRRKITTTTEAPTTKTESATTRAPVTLPDYPEFERFEPEVESTTTTRSARPAQREHLDLDEDEVEPTTHSVAPPPSVDYPLFDRFDPTLNGIPSISQSGDSSFHSIVPSSGDSQDYIAFNDPEVIPIQIGRIPAKGKGKSGRPNLSLLSHRRHFDSLHTETYRSANRGFGLLLCLVLTVATLPSLLIVILGAMNYGRGSHPMDRSKISDMVGVLSVVMSLFLLFIVPLLLLYSTVGLLFSHTHHTLCPLVQPPTDTLEDVILVMEGCARVQTPLIRMEQSALMAALSAFPAAVILLQLSNYFLRMRREHYWTHSDSDLM